MTKIYWLFGACCLWCTTAFTQGLKTEQLLFENVFGNRKAGGSQRISVPVFLDNRELGLVEIDLSLTPIRVSVKNMSSLVKGILKPEVAALLDAEQKNTWINLDQLSQLGIKAEYSDRKIALDLSLGLDLRMEKSIQIDQRLTMGRETSLPMIESQKYSLILNTRIVQSWQQSHLAPTIQSGRIFTDWAARTGDWVTEVSGSFATDASGGGFNRSETRLLRDWSDEAIRLTIGDSVSAVRGALGPQVLGGVRLTRQFGINPKINNLSLPSDKLALTAGGAVDVDVNGYLVRTLRLDPGVYNLKDIYAFQGANDISIRVVEPGGRVTVRRFDYFFDSSLLAPGLHEWDLAVGAPSSTTATGRRYEGGEKLGSFWWRKGWSNYMTAGGGLQVISGSRMNSRVVQLESAWTNQWGAWAGWLAGSSREVANRPDLSGQGLAQMLQWRGQTMQRPQNAWSSNLTIQVTHLGRQYSSVENLSPSFASYDMGMRAGLSWDKDWSASLGASRQISEDVSRNGRAITLGLRRRIDKEWSLDGTLGHSQNAGVTQNFFTIALRYSPFVASSGLERTGENTNWRANSSYQSIDHRWQNDVEAAGYSSKLDAAWRINGTRTQSNIGDETAFRTRVQTNRGDSTWTTIQTRDRALGASAYHEWTLSNALVVSGAGIKISGPIYDSAVVFTPKAGFESSKLLIDPQSDRAAAASDRWGTPVLSNVFSYSAREIQLDIENLPPGKTLGNDRWVLFPKYRSVTEVPVGTDANTQVNGILANIDGAPIVLESLRVVAQDGGGRVIAPIEIFSNRKGQFVTPPLSPGRYQIIRLLDDAMLYQFEILPSQSGNHSIGILKIKD